MTNTPHISVQNLNLYYGTNHALKNINIDIPDKKVTFLIGEINKELVSLERQMDVINVKSKIPKEEGEEDFLKMLDTTRAIPNASTSPLQLKTTDQK